MSHSQPVQGPTSQPTPTPAVGPLPPPRPVINRTEAQQARVTQLIDLMQQLVQQMDAFWASQIQTPHIPQSATQVREILAVLLPEITSLGPELREHEQAQVMGMLHHVTQRVDAVSTAHIQATQVLKEEQAYLAGELEKMDHEETAQDNTKDSDSKKVDREETTKDDSKEHSIKKVDQEKMIKDDVKEDSDIKKMQDLETAALKAQLTMRNTLTECLAELDSELRKEMRKKYL
ncbi:hypothetical protein H4S07_002212 [Coemansia furcata]|uniref:Uncharacterized protein n=1 Tax=Coemansia furcata TaxID=417177 RepID=A0ACC1LL90_9FUNG|nr:hypothetical protein H4S07_002212 [Coemansia furcata]